MKKICNILIGIIITCLIIIAGLLLLPGVFGYQNFAVISGSMEPNIPVGAVVYAKSAPFEELQVGDIISFDTNGTKVTHRIAAINAEEQSFTTKGDANDVEDSEAVSYQKVIGKVAFTVPLLGFLSVYIKTPLGIAIGCGVVFVIILLNFLPDIFDKEHKKEKKK